MNHHIISSGLTATLISVALAACSGNVGEHSDIELGTQGAALTGTNAVPVMTSNSSSQGVVEASGKYSSEYEPFKAFDGSSSMWISEVWETPAWISFAWPDGPRRVTGYAIHYTNGSITTRAPRDWNLEGWNGSSWVVVDQRSAEVNWGGSERREFEVQSPGDYSSYRLLVTDDNDSRAGVVVISLGSLELFAENQVRSCAPIFQSDRLHSKQTMETTLTYDPLTGVANMGTVLENGKRGSGYTGGAAVVFVDQNSMPIHTTDVEQWGLDGCLFVGCPRRREASWSTTVPEAVRARVAGVAIMQAHTRTNRALGALGNFIASSSKLCEKAATALEWQGTAEVCKAVAGVAAALNPALQRHIENEEEDAIEEVVASVSEKVQWLECQ